MSAMVISSVEKFMEMSGKLQDVGFSNIHLWNSEKGELDTPIIALVPFVDFVILGKDANLSWQLSKVIDEAMARHIPVVSEECLDNLKNFCR